MVEELNLKDIHPFVSQEPDENYESFKADSVRKIIVISVLAYRLPERPMMTDWHKRLEEVTGYRTFKPGNWRLALDRQENVVAILPTGGVIFNIPNQ